MEVFNINTKRQADVHGLSAVKPNLTEGVIFYHHEYKSEPESENPATLSVRRIAQL